MEGSVGAEAEGILEGMLLHPWALLAALLLFKAFSPCRGRSSTEERLKKWGKCHIWAAEMKEAETTSTTRAGAEGVQGREPAYINYTH